MRALGSRVGVVAVLLGACGFPEITFRNDLATSTEDATEASVEAAAREREAQLRAAREGSSSATMSCVTKNPCDCDGDGYLAKTATCAGNDCDDSDAFVHPGADFGEATLAPGETGDRDCNGVVEKRYPTDVDCSSLLGLDCNGAAQGFAGDPPCGTTAEYFKCAPDILSCAAVKTGPRRQACK